MERIELGDRVARAMLLENLYANSKPPSDLAVRLYGAVDLEDVIVSNMVLFHERALRRRKRGA